VFNDLYRHYFKGLCAFASQYVTRSEAEEVVQDTMLWLWENTQTLIPEMSLKSLLFIIVKNKSLNRISHNQIKNRIHQEIVEKFEKQFEDPDFYLENELLDLFANAIKKLPIDIRNAFEMNRLEGLTHKEIADRLNVSPQTINYRISNALKILRLELKDYLPILLYIYLNK
jgi:RNA polymerase sigma-70 factor, ECF subfamily